MNTRPNKLPGAWLIDIEGVLVRDKRYQPVPGSLEWFNGLVASGVPLCLVSNNTTDRPGDLVDRLVKLGFQVQPHQLVGALGLSVQWLRQRGRRRILWLGHPGLESYWRDEGFETTGPQPVQAVVLGANSRLGTADLDRALEPLLDQGADLVCPHRNLFFLDEEGRPRLGPGVWAAGLEALKGAGQVVTVGKPAEPIYHEALKRVGVEPTEALFISDDPLSDLVTAGRLGMTTAFVLSGKYSDHAVLGRMEQDQWPHIVCRCPADVMAGLDGSHDES